MYTKRLIILYSLIVAFLVLTSIVYKKYDNKKIYIEQNGIKLAIDDGNGNTLNNVPAKGFYDVTVDCTNGEGSWDYNLWKLVVKNITGNITCDLSFSSVSTSQTLAQYIISLSGTTQGDGQVANENGYRYQGENPNNYILFNDELWRIIGVFGSNRHGVSNTNLVKIIRAEPIGAYSWDGSYTNAWPNTTLYRMLNGCYYNALTSSDTTNISGSSVACSNYCRNYESISSTNCNFSVIGIQNNGLDVSYRDMIQSVTWYLGGITISSSAAYYPSDFYTAETDSTAIYSGNPTSTTGNVGLMYASDYGYAASSSCTRGSYIINYNNSWDSNPSGYYSNNVCANNNWLYGFGFEWTITPNVQDAKRVWRIDPEGYIHAYGTRTSYSTRPVAYLKAKTYKLSGTGSQADPYIIGKDYEYNNTFSYSSSVQTLTIVKSGYYKLQVYGAAGGNGYNSSTYAGGKGGYANGVIHLNASDVLYIHTGGAGKGSTSKAVQSGGTNGGGAGGYNYGGSGGGATDIRINTDSLYARVIVGGGGGGGAYYSGYSGGAGGGTSGGNGTGYSTSYNAKGGGTTSGGTGGSYNGGSYKGTDGSFGNGGAAATSTTNNYGRSGGGGGGWYGGGGGGYRGNSSYYYYGQSGGGGGSSYTYSSSTASQVPSGWLLNSSYYMTSTSTTSGSRSGNGYAVVTYCGQAASDCS